MTVATLVALGAVAAEALGLVLRRGRPRDTAAVAQGRHRSDLGRVTQGRGAAPT